MFCLFLFVDGVHLQLVLLLDIFLLLFQLLGSQARAASSSSVSVSFIVMTCRRFVLRLSYIRCTLMSQVTSCSVEVVIECVARDACACIHHRPVCPRIVSVSRQFFFSHSNRVYDGFITWFDMNAIEEKTLGHHVAFNSHRSVRQIKSSVVLGITKNRPK